jgi:hypothetical protein
MENNPPSPPIIKGPKIGKISKMYEYKFTSSDPDGDDIRYFIDWGDGTFLFTDYYLSGETLQINYIYPEKGNFIIKAKSQDIYGAQSNWGIFEITMAKKLLVDIQSLLSPWFF